MWALVDVAATIIAMPLAQFALAISLNPEVGFPAIEKNHNTAVVSADCGGVSLGSTPAAMADMSDIKDRNPGKGFGQACRATFFVLRILRR